MSTEEKLRLKEQCCSMWSQLNDNEKEYYYYGAGTIEFVETVATTLDLNIDLLTVYELDEIIDAFDK